VVKRLSNTARAEQQTRSRQQASSAAIAAAALLIGLALLAFLLPRLSKPATPSIETPSAIDIGFAQSMSLHHQQAIAMSQLMLDGRPTPLAQFARGIASAQLLELGEMRGWLRLWDAPFIAAKQGMDWMRSADRALTPEELQYLLDCQRAPTGMTGLATDDQVNRLRFIDGRERDARYLRLMLAHHDGGLPMARFVAEQARVAAVRELAARVVLEQSKEIYLIQRMLAALAAQDAEGSPPLSGTP
jgi:uncharacterized protein (DUF305 family)